MHTHSHMHWQHPTLVYLWIFTHYTHQVICVHLSPSLAQPLSQSSKFVVFFQFFMHVLLLSTVIIYFFGRLNNYSVCNGHMTFTTVKFCTELTVLNAYPLKTSKRLIWNWSIPKCDCHTCNYFLGWIRYCEGTNASLNGTLWQSIVVPWSGLHTSPPLGEILWFMSNRLLAIVHTTHRDQPIT